jgi:hypothetical protein
VSGASNPATEWIAVTSRASSAPSSGSRPTMSSESRVDDAEDRKAAPGMC